MQDCYNSAVSSPPGLCGCHWRCELTIPSARSCPFSGVFPTWLQYLRVISSCLTRPCHVSLLMSFNIIVISMSCYTNSPPSCHPIPELSDRNTDLAIATLAPREIRLRWWFVLNAEHHFTNLQFYAQVHTGVRMCVVWCTEIYLHCEHLGSRSGYRVNPAGRTSRTSTKGTVLNRLVRELAPCLIAGVKSPVA